jgi:hypothetical protein
VSESQFQLSVKLISISPDYNVKPVRAVIPTNAGKNMAGTRTCVVEFLRLGVAPS